MTRHMRYDELTWPDVAALPRDMPLILPLGDGYDQTRVADMVGAPAQIGWLPPVPFGWRGSGLAVPEPILGAMVSNLLLSLRDDGFSRVFALTPQGIDLGLGGLQLMAPHAGNRQDNPPAPPAADAGKVVLIPIGHTEQHGYHLPLQTDTVIIDAVMTATQARVPEQATLLPVFPYGVSTHRTAFAGTLNCGGRAFEDFWLAVVDLLVARGFDRIYFNSGHGGNCSFLVTVVKYAGERHRRIFCATTWLHTSGEVGAAALAAHRVSGRGGMGHAGELETAMMLHLRPELCHMARVVDEIDFVTTPNYYMDWIEGGALVANPPWEDDTVTGAYGAGSVATEANDVRWLEAAIAEKVSHVQEIHQQQQLREARRTSGFGRWSAQ